MIQPPVLIPFVWLAGAAALAFVMYLLAVVAMMNRP